jgi:hypothetical protein
MQCPPRTGIEGVSGLKLLRSRGLSRCHTQLDHQRILIPRDTGTSHSGRDPRPASGFEGEVLVAPGARRGIRKKKRGTCQGGQQSKNYSSDSTRVQVRQLQSRSDTEQTVCMMSIDTSPDLESSYFVQPQDTRRLQYSTLAYLLTTYWRDIHLCIMTSTACSPHPLGTNNFSH